MKTNIAIVFDDETRARVRAFYGRGGMATRSEIRRFVLDELEQSVKELPPAKRRGSNSSRRTCKSCGRKASDILKVNGGATALDVNGICAACKEADAEASADELCAKCGKPRADHTGRAFNCPLGLHVKPRWRFTPAEAAK